MTYNEFILSIINTRGLWEISEGEYYENHHIIPRCLGGEPKRLLHTQKHENSIWLYPKEHFIAHKLLAEEYRDNYKIIYAWKLMWLINEYQERYEPSPEEYELLKLTIIECKDRYKPSEETKLLISESNKGKHHRTLTDEEKLHLSNINTGKLNPNYGLHRSQETKDKISKANKGKKASIETRQKLSESHKGNTSALGHKLSDESKKLISEKLKGKKISAERCLEISARLIGNTYTKGRKWYNNSIENKLCIPGTLPEGWIEGRLPVSLKTKDNLSVSKSGENNPFYGTHYYNDGNIEIRSKTCPNGFVLGRLNRR